MNKLLGVLLCLVGCANFAYAGWGWGSKPAPEPPKSPSLYVAELRDAGGLPTGNGEKLNVKLTSAFRKIIAGEAKDTVAIPDQPAKPRRGSTAWTLEGDLSGFDNGQGIVGYCCVMRLYREGKQRELVTEWSGIADTLRYLTGNLMQHPAVHDYGLVGDIGHRALSIIKADDGKAEFEQMLTELTHTLPEARETTVTLSPLLPPAEIVGTPLPLLAAGKPFSVEVNTAQPVTVLYAIQSETDIRLVHAQKALKNPGMYARLQFSAPTPREAKTVRLVLLLHVKKITQADTPVPVNTPTLTETAPPVRIVETLNRQTQNPTSLSEILQMLPKSDPYGSWLYKTIDYRLAR